MAKHKFHITYKHANIKIVTDLEISENEVREIVQTLVLTVENFVETHQDWEKSFDPVITTTQIPLIRAMEEAAHLAQVGPMAAVAGAIADLLAQDLKNRGAQIIVVENGGEIFIESAEDINIGILSETTSLKGTLGVKYRANQGTLGVGTSSGQFGHALSLGNADLVTVFADNAAIADAAATYIANHVTGDDPEEAIQKGLESYRTLNGEQIHGALLHKAEKIGTIGTLPPLIQIED